MPLLSRWGHDHPFWPESMKTNVIQTFVNNNVPGILLDECMVVRNGMGR